MLRDVFYYGQKPNVHAREKPAKNLEDARQQATTDHFWIVNEFCDYTNFDWDFDFDFLDDDQVWTELHNNIWPSQHQKDSGTWLCSKKRSDVLVYRTDVNPVIRKNIKTENWKVNELIDENTFDFSWHPDPTSPPYIYAWGCRYFPPTHKTVVQYAVDNASDYKYMDGFVELLPDHTKWKILDNIDKTSFDFRWRPDPKSPPYIYVWGNQHYPAEIMPTIEYHVEGAIDRKYIDSNWHVKLAEYKERFEILANITNFDYTWRPNPKDPPYIYVFGNQHYSAEVMPTVRYIVEGASEVKYVNDIVATLASDKSKFKIHTPIDESKFDFSWIPDPNEPPFIYVWGNKHVPGEIQPTVEYVTDDAVNKKFIHNNVIVLPDYDRWTVFDNIDKTNFDFSWRPDPTSPPYIYVWGNKHVDAQTSPTIQYTVPGATEYKFMNELVDVLPNTNNWFIYQKVDAKEFDFSWRPNPKSPPYIYVWGNKHISGEISPTIEYHVEGAIEKKFIHNDVGLLPDMEKWRILEPIDSTQFDFTWIPDPTSPPYIYVFGNKHNDATIESSIEYVVPGATEYKYMTDIIAPVLPNKNKFVTYCEIDENTFDFSWRPNPKSPPYIYVWGNKYVPAEIAPTVEYRVEGANDYKYMGNVDVLPETDRWTIYQDIDKSKFDFSWRPNPKSPPYIYIWGNKYIPGQKKPTLTYHTPEATEIKYQGDVDVLPEWEKWKIFAPVNKDSFDFSWRPDPNEPPFIYVWGNKHVPGQVKSTIEYHCQGATQKKFVGDVEILPQWDNWVIIQQPKNFDFSWVPDPTAEPYIYVWGNKYIPGEKRPTITYNTPGATQYKYMGNDVEVEPEYDKWKILIPVVKSSFDFSWRPDPDEPAFIYVWGNQSNNAETEPTIEYYSEGLGIEPVRKYMSNMVAKTLPISENWEVLLPVENFDFSWRPNPGSPPYIYVFGNQWNKAEIEPTVMYKVPGATEYSYINDIVATVSPAHENWKVLLPVENFDFSWRPNPHDPPYIYVFGNQWNKAEIQHTLEYHVPNAIEYKYVDTVAYLKSNYNEFWKNLIPIEHFDYSWVPDPTSPPYIYVFGNKCNEASVEPSVEYHMPGATDRKYMTNPVAIPSIDMKYWSVSSIEDLETFDFSWRPNPHSPSQIYQWENNGPRYTVPDSKEVVLMERTEAQNKKEVPKYYIKTTLEDLIKQHSDEVFWALNPDLTYENFNFNWKPNSENFRHINVFGNENAKDTQTYYVNGPLYMLGNREYNYVTEQKVEINETNLSMFFIDRNNKESNQRFKDLQIRYPNIIKTRYLNNWADTISRCIRKAKTNLFWVLNSEYDYTDFKFDFYPSPWQMQMIHVFGTQWSHWGQTYLINGSTFDDDTKYVKVIEHLPNLNFVKAKIAKATDCLYDVYLIDHGNKETEEIKENLQNKCVKNVIVVSYVNSYLNTFKNILSQTTNQKEHYIWICSSVCDYNKFDFSYICDPFAKENLHVFASDKQKFGDTFLVDVNKLRSLIDHLKYLEDYSKVNYIEHIKAKRLPAPEFCIDNDTHSSSYMLKFDYPYAIVKSNDNHDISVNYEEPLNLWANHTKNIESLSTGGAVLVLPKEVDSFIKAELYDYPYISKAKRLAKSKPLDIVFLSNGEKQADENYEHLLRITKGLPNRVVRVDGVNGRVQAYHAAADASDTGWLFTVFAKLKVDEKFDFSWQPDRLQIPKHYIFTAKNPVNGLIYGHQAMIAYNKKLTLLNKGRGLDFTLDDPHDSVDMLSGIANFNTDAYSTWRTAFREVIKLKSDYEQISADRLNIWLTQAQGNFAEDCLRGAHDAVEFYNEVGGDVDQLKLSYEWEWLYNRYNKKYK